MSTLLNQNDQGILSAQDKPDVKWELSALIRSRADALIVYRNADWFGSEESASE